MSIVIFFVASYALVLILAKNTSYLNFVLYSKPEGVYLHNYYTKKFVFYTQLKPAKQKRFIHRVILIRKTNKIKIDKEILHVNHDIDLMVSAAFVQITFGYSNFEISRFSKIIIYPDSFYSKLAGDHVNGLTVGKGFIYLSWNHFLKGYQTNDDRVNLALHELAHALYIDRFHSHGGAAWFDWEEKAAKVFKLINRNPELTFYRDYAKTNMAEFWAVTVECFFEAPANFRSQFPELYFATSNLLQQDLLAND